MARLFPILLVGVAAVFAGVAVGESAADDGTVVDRDGKDHRLADTRLIELPQKPDAPPLGLRDLAGLEHRIAAYRGRVVVVNFWATWCVPCRREIPALQNAHESLSRDDIVVLAVNVGEPRSRVGRFLTDTGITFPVLTDPSGAIYRRWQLQGLPTTYVLDPSGRIIYGAIGERDWADPGIVSKIRALAR